MSQLYSYTVFNVFSSSFKIVCVKTVLSKLPDSYIKARNSIISILQQKQPVILRNVSHAVYFEKYLHINI